MKKNEKIIGSHLYMVDEVDSTNKELLNNVDKYEHGSVFCAKQQYAGKGRYKRQWESAEGGLYFSFILKNQNKIQDAYPLVLLTALAVTRCISSCASHGIAIKWPNDIYINHRKICGILSESLSMGEKHHVIIGVGINVNNSVMHLEGLRHPAVSLKECKGEELDVLGLLDRVSTEIDLLYKDFISNNFSNHLDELNRYLYSRDSEIEIQTPEGVKTITPLAFTKEAKLLCREDGEEKELFMGEI